MFQPPIEELTETKNRQIDTVKQAGLILQEKKLVPSLNQICAKLKNDLRSIISETYINQVCNEVSPEWIQKQFTHKGHAVKSIDSIHSVHPIVERNSSC